MPSPRLGLSRNEMIAREICSKVDRLLAETNDVELVKRTIINYLNSISDEKLKLTIKTELTYCHPYLIDNWVN